MTKTAIRQLESPSEMTLVEGLQRVIWPGSETDIVPAHLLLTAAHNGGLVLGAFAGDEIVGFVFGFPGLDMLPDGPHPKHCSHMLGVHPAWRDSGIGFDLKRAQWQMVRHMGIGHSTWTYDPLLSRNAYLNITKLGAVCNTYRRSEYGDMRDGLNAGLPSDRFQIDWWLNTRRVERRLGKQFRQRLSMELFSKANLRPHYRPQFQRDGLMYPPENFSTLTGSMLLAEIPSDFIKIKRSDLALARDWRFFAREFFEKAFSQGYIITDFVFERTGQGSRSLYVMTNGEANLEDLK